MWLLASVGNESPLVDTPNCGQQGPVEAIGWRHVHDGDTLVLEDGRRLRVIGINAPEVSGDGPGEPYADQATRAAQAFLQGSNTLLIQPGSDERDRYGRLLAHVFRSADGASLAVELISRGLAWQIAVPPNLAYLDCNRTAEVPARKAGRGLWSSQYLATEHAGRLQSGFRVLRGRIEKIAFGGNNWWLETDAGFVARIASRDQAWFNPDQLERLEGVEVELRGWMYNRSGSGAVRRGYQPWVLTLRHPSALRTVN